MCGEKRACVLLAQQLEGNGKGYSAVTEAQRSSGIHLADLRSKPMATVDTDVDPRHLDGVNPDDDPEDIEP